MGLSTFLYFRTIINTSILLLLLVLIYAGFASFINYYVSISSYGLSITKGFEIIVSNYDTVFSYKSVETNYIVQSENVTNFTRIGAILIMVVIIVWSILVYVFKHYEV